MNDEIQIAGISFPTLVAVTPEEHAQGLMWKKWPPPVMVFPYNRAEVRKFWMRNTLSPLDIVFCNDDTIIDICYGEPMSTRLIGPERASNLVIELPHGTVEQHKFAVGDKVRLSVSRKTIARDISNVFNNLIK